jgi:hypothetical protein
MTCYSAPSINKARLKFKHCLFYSGRASPVDEELDTSDEVPPELLNDDDDDDEDEALREAIRLSQLDHMSESELRKREEEEFEKVRHFLEVIHVLF